MGYLHVDHACDFVLVIEEVMQQSNRYFIALLPPTSLQDVAREFQMELKNGYNTKAALNSPPHITLHMPFSWNEDKLQILNQHLSDFAGQVKPFSVQLINFGAFPPRVIFIHVEPTEDLMSCQQRLERHCKVNLNLFNAEYRDRPFHPHLTLAFRDLRKANFAAAWDGFASRKYSNTFTVYNLTLLKHSGREWVPARMFPFGDTSR